MGYEPSTRSLLGGSAHRRRRVLWRLGIGRHADTDDVFNADRHKDTSRHEYAGPGRYTDS